MTTKLFSFSLLLLALTGCGQTALPLDPPTPEDTPKYSGTCAGLFNAYATWATGCLGTPIPDELREDLVAHCTARQALPGISVTPAAFIDCEEKIAASYCASLPLECLSPADYAAQTTLTWLGGSVAPSHYEVFPRSPGSLARGSACALSAQCQSGTCQNQETCGVCVEMKSVGEACDATSFCRESECQSGVCVEVGVAAGDACQDTKGDSDCLSGLYCSNNVCVPRIQVWGPCPDDYRPVCAEGSQCVQSVCQPIEPVHEGEACDYPLHPCTGEGLDCRDGTCRRPLDDVPVGGACMGDTCAKGLHCVDWVCSLPVGAGAPCTEPASCVDGLTCLHAPGGAGHCGAPLGAGVPCQEFRECESGLVCLHSESPVGTCTAWSSLTTSCGEQLPCGGDQVCRWGECVAIDSCSAP